ncbi:MAG: hypothetical protein M9960_10355 [Xanthomonadaceae bacterium]|nr:hypothetical protein [Xanthomonadaceae bacterium]
MKWNPALVLAAALAPAGVACAQGVAYVDVPVQGRENVSYAYADVLRAIPTYEINRIVEPVVQCGEETLDASARTNAGDGLAPNGPAQKAAADASGPGKGTGTEAAAPPCRTVMVEREERRISGYDVEYRYKGELYLSRMDVDPGNKLRIRVTVAPAD